MRRKQESWRRKIKIWKVMLWEIERENRFKGRKREGETGREKRERERFKEDESTQEKAGNAITIRLFRVTFWNSSQSLLIGRYFGINVWKIFHPKYEAFLHSKTIPFSIIVFTFRFSSCFLCFFLFFYSCINNY